METIRNYVRNLDKSVVSHLLVFLLGIAIAGAAAYYVSHGGSIIPKPLDEVQTIINTVWETPGFKEMSAKQKEVYMTQELYQGFYCKKENGLDAAQQKAQEALAGNK